MSHISPWNALQEPEKYFLQADVYSFGVTLWELLERKRPYKGMDPYQIQASLFRHAQH